jgi:hypothetical protein
MRPQFNFDGFWVARIILIFDHRSALQQQQSCAAIRPQP